MPQKSYPFYHIEAKSLHTLGKFDVITAISVLCRYPESKLIQNIDSVFPFSIFEKSVGYLDQVLNSEGYLFIRSSNFRFMETEYNKKYKVISFKGQRQPEIFPKFNKNNCRLEVLKNEKNYFKSFSFCQQYLLTIFLRFCKINSCVQNAKFEVHLCG